MSLVPAGIYQARAAISHGLWFARSPQVVHSPVMETLVWLRVPGDVVFVIGGLLLAQYAARLLLAPRARVIQDLACVNLSEPFNKVCVIRQHGYNV